MGAGLETLDEGDAQWLVVGHLHGFGDAAGSSPLETLAELAREYRRVGRACFERLRGAFVLARLTPREVLLVRDPGGARTLYYGRHEGRLLFAVEPKGVLAAPDFPRRLRPAAIAQYLTFSFIPGERTMLEDLYELPAGHVLQCALPDGEPTLHRYFHFEHAERELDLEEDHWVERFKQLHASAVAERDPGEEPIAVFLSGGLDSSAVVAELAEQRAARGASAPLTYAIHFGRKYPNELEFAAAVAKRHGTEHQEVEVKPKHFLPRLRRIIWHLDDPIGDPITVPNFELASRVSRDARFVFNGEGGDPLFGGPKNIPMLLHHWYGGVERGPHFREKMYLESYRRGYEEWPRLLQPEWRDQVIPERDLEGMLTPFFDAEAPQSFLNKLCVINMRLKGAHLILPKVERMTAAWGLCPLSPLFDERLMLESMRMPPKMKLRAGVEKVVLKRAYQNRLPPEIIERPKSGMRVPVHFWFKSEMRRYAKKLLSKKELEKAGIWNPDRVAQLLAYEIEEGPGRYGLRLWMLLTFEIWRRIVIEGEAV